MRFTLIRFRRITSSQDWARAWAELGAPEGLAVQALAQTAGRGRLQRRWHSPHRGGLYLSVLLRPRIPLLQANRLTMLAALAAQDACGAVAGLWPQPKWPNDLLLAGRKLAGILTELENQEDRLGYAVIGLGLNANIDFAGSPLADAAISLRQAAGREVSISALRDAYLAALAQRYRRFLAGESPLPAWRERLHPLGRRVRVVRRGQPDLSGAAIAVNDEGALLVRSDDSQVHVIWAGDVRVQEG